MYLNLFAVAALLSLASGAVADALVLRAQTCKKNACLSTVKEHHNAGHDLACTAFLRKTVTPRTMITVHTTTHTSTFQFTRTSSLTSTTTESTITSTTLPPAPTGGAPHRLARRAKEANTPTTRSASIVPLYARDACSNSAEYSSACSCVGVKAERTTVPAPRSTRTVTTSKIVVSKTTTTTTSVVSLASATARCNTVTATFNEDGSSAKYINYYSGAGFTEASNNPGNQGSDPSLVAQFPAPVPNDSCAAILKCANLAVNERFGGYTTPYFSFDVHFLKSLNLWECVQYFDPNFNSSYFNVANSDVTEGYGYAI